jgi:hypothetical protein
LSPIVEKPKVTPTQPVEIPKVMPNQPVTQPIVDKPTPEVKKSVEPTKPTSEPVKTELPQLRKDKPKKEFKNIIQLQDEDENRKERRKSKEVISPIVKKGSQLYYPPNTLKKWKLDGTFNV